jgi:hypothetical protein
VASVNVLDVLHQAARDAQKATRKHALSVPQVEITTKHKHIEFPYVEKYLYIMLREAMSLAINVSSTSIEPRPIIAPQPVKSKGFFGNLFKSSSATTQGSANQLVVPRIRAMATQGHEDVSVRVSVEGHHFADSEAQIDAVIQSAAFNRLQQYAKLFDGDVEIVPMANEGLTIYIQLHKCDTIPENLSTLVESELSKSFLK